MLKSRKEKVIWAAGFVDGEGALMLSRQKHDECFDGFYYVICFQVGQKKREPLDFLAGLFWWYGEAKPGRVFLLALARPNCRESVDGIGAIPSAQENPCAGAYRFPITSVSWQGEIKFGSNQG
jgi:hypothetical protein